MMQLAKTTGQYSQGQRDYPTRVLTTRFFPTMSATTSECSTDLGVS